MGGTALMAAAFASRLDVVEFLCMHGADVLKCTRDGGHALAAAAINGNLAILQILLDNGGTECVNTLDARKASPIMLAAQAGHVEASYDNPDPTPPFTPSHAAPPWPSVSSTEPCVLRLLGTLR